MERVRRVAAVRGGIGKRPDDLQLLADRPGPPVLGLSIEDLVAAASVTTLTARSPAPTLSEYVAIVEPTFTEGTAATYRSYWRLAEARFGDRPIETVDLAEWELVLTDALARARRRRPGTDGRSSKENGIGALRAILGQAERARVITWNSAAELAKPGGSPADAGRSMMPS